MTLQVDPDKKLESRSIRPVVQSGVDPATDSASLICFEDLVDPDRESIALDPTTLALETITRARLKQSASVQNRFLEQVIIPASVILPENIIIKQGEHNGIPLLYLSHPVTHKSLIHTLSYLVLFNDVNRVKAPFYPSTKETNIIQVPANFDADDLVHLQNAWRATTIADPGLNSRFSSEEIIFAPYQDKAVESILRAFKEKGIALIHMATGTGKTLVAHKALTAWAEENKLQEAAIVFLVDNTLALGEAENKVKLLFGNKYKVSRLYEGHEGYDGDFICTTPSSLMSSGRLKKLLKKRKIAGVVLDEVHHIAATEYRLIKRTVNEKSPSTVILGQTATMDRPDEVSVVDQFGGQINFSYSLAQAWREGYLTRLKIVEGDLDINPERLTPVRPDTVLHDKYHQQRYSEGRFPHIYDLYRQSTEGELDKRTLILAPNITYAKKLAAHFRTEGVIAQALTYEDRGTPKNNETFMRVYNAWKYGMWESGSTTDVPEVIVGVKMFRESVDVPDVRNLIIIGVTKSTLAFLQDIGRGLRPAELKALLRLIDAGGVLREPENIKVLGRILREAGVFAKEADESSSLGIGASLGTSIEGYIADVPVQLAEKYIEYSLIDSIDDLRRLDDFIVAKCGFASKEELEKYLLDCAKKATALPPAKIRSKAHGVLHLDQQYVTMLSEMREKLKSAFCLFGIYDMSDEGEIPITPETYIVFHRLNDLIPQDGEQISNDVLYRILPEFHKDKARELRYRAENLRFLRAGIFRVGRKKMVEKLVDDVIRTGLVSSDSHDALFMMDQYNSVVWRGEPDGLALAEGNFVDPRSIRKRLGKAVIPSDSYATVGNKALQDHCIGIYLAHPRLRALVDSYDLKPETFSLPPEEFRQAIYLSKIIDEVTSPIEYINSLSAYVRGYTHAIQSGHSDSTIQRNRAALLAFLSNKENIEWIKAHSLRTIDIKRLHYLSGEIDLALGKLGRKKTERDNNIRGLFNDVLCKSRVYCVVDLVDLPDITLALERKQPKKYQLSLIPKSRRVRGSFANIPIKVEHIVDHLGRPHIFFSRDCRIKYKRDEDDKIMNDGVRNDFENVYESLDSLEKAALVDGVLEIVKSFDYDFIDKPVLVFPKDREGCSFYTDLYERAKEDVERDVLGQLDEVVYYSSGHGERLDIEYTLADIHKSRLSFLTRDEIASLREKSHPRNSHLINRIATLYLSLYQFRTSIISRWNIARQRLNQYSPSPDVRPLVIGLLRGIDSQLKAPDLKFHPYFARLSSTLIYLCDGYPDEGLTDDKVRFVCVYDKVCGDTLPMAKISICPMLKDEASRSNYLEVAASVKKMMNSFLFLKARKIPIPHELLKDVNSYVKYIAERLFNSNAVVDYSLKGYTDRLAERIDQIYKSTL